MEFCCKNMKDNIDKNCSIHNECFKCPDTLIYYNQKFDEFGIIIHDGGMSYIHINFCPWCGKKLPESKRDRWFDELEQLGYDSPFDMDIPVEYKSNKWYK
ncbi:hypothetical protein K0040_11895 [Terrisporobacter petrolearius]|uniref:DUF6980 family protein n=1 Tax=Terrisporobacter petrolearius TaxID=1460447 RepID=UPI00292FCDB5|nr:hypothetical protein [Terrisporobacter petrolearius]MCC3864975.1 hypothetical protein [Terrisporobacter petrolearius]